jgi:hypothetical protein
MERSEKKGRFMPDWFHDELDEDDKFLPRPNEGDSFL